MKKILLLLFVATTLLTSAQVIVEYSGGKRTNVDASAVDSVTFYRPEATTQSSDATVDGNADIALVLTDGTIVYFKLDERPKLMLYRNVTISTDKTKVEYEYSQVRSVMSGAAAKEGISDPTVKAKSIDFEIIGRNLSIRSMNSGETLTVYTIDGKTVVNAVADNGEATVVLPDAGVYIVRTSRGVAFKILCN